MIAPCAAVGGDEQDIAAKLEVVAAAGPWGWYY